MPLASNLHLFDRLSAIDDWMWVVVAGVVVWLLVVGFTSREPRPQPPAKRACGPCGGTGINVALRSGVCPACEGRGEGINRPRTGE